MTRRADGGAIIGRSSGSTGETVLGCVVAIAIVAFVIYLFIPKSGPFGKIEPVQDAAHFNELDPWDRSKILYGFGSNIYWDEKVVLIRADEGEIRLDDRVYFPGDTVQLTASAGRDSGGPAVAEKHKLRSVSLVSPASRTLFDDPEAGFGSTVSFDKNIQTNSTYSEKGSAPVEIALDAELLGAGGNVKRTLEFKIAYVYAMAYSNSSTFTTGSGEQSVQVDLVPVTVDGQAGYVFRDPDRPRQVYVVENEDHTWSVEVDFAKTEAWDVLVAWSPLVDPETGALVYAGGRGKRYDFAIDRPGSHVTSLEGEGYSEIGAFTPVFDEGGIPIFTARKEKQWCVVRGPVDFPLHDGVGGQIVPLGGGQFVYAAKDGKTWSLMLASAEGRELAVLAGLPAIVQITGDDRTGSFAAVVYRPEKPAAVLMVRSLAPAAQLTAENAAQNMVAGPPFIDITDVTWFPNGELVYVGEDLEDKSMRMVVDGTVIPKEDGKALLLASCPAGSADCVDAVTELLTRYDYIYGLK